MTDRESQGKLSGTVTSGLGKAGRRLERVGFRTQEALGFRPYPGTLNIQLDMPLKPSEGWRFVDIPMLGEKKVPFRLFKARLNGYPVLVARSKSQLESSDTILEVIADTRLRETLQVEDGDKILLEFESVEE